MTWGGITQDDNGKWIIDRDFLTPERAALLDQLDEKHEALRTTPNAKRPPTLDP